jgi:ectoine hydrolase
MSHEGLKRAELFNEFSVYTPAFSKEEYMERIKNLKVLFQTEGEDQNQDQDQKPKLDWIIMFSPHLLYYFTGFTGWSFYVPQFLLINKNVILETELGSNTDIVSNSLFLILRGMDSAAAFSTTHLNKNQVLIYPDHYIDNCQKHPISLLKDLIKAEDNLGLEMDSSYSKATYYLEFQKLLVGAGAGAGAGGGSIRDISLLLNRQRIIKSPAELDYIKRAALISDISIQEALNSIKAGITTAEIAGKIINTQLKMGGTYTGLAPMLMVDEASAHMNWSNVPLRTGQMVNIEMSAAYLHYHCPISRSIFIGNREQLMNGRHWNVLEKEMQIQKALVRLLDFIRPGVQTMYIAYLFDNELKKHGFCKKSRIAYSFGLGFPPDWGENTLSVRLEDNVEIREGMCLHFILGSGDAWAYQYSEAMIIRSDGPELLCKTPRILYFSEGKNYKFNFTENYDNYLPALHKYLCK